MNLLVGNQEFLPQDLKNNKGHNVFYCLPLLLGLIGLFWQAYHSQRGIQQFWIGILPVLHDGYRHCALPQPDACTAS